MSADIAPKSTDRNVATDWEQAHRHTPAPRHRRRLITREVRRLGSREVLDAGCGGPFLVEELVRELGISAAGCDISNEAMATARRELPEREFETVDLEHERWPGGRTFELVVCSETLEHIPDWRAALRNVVAMADRHVIVTVPAGLVRPIDKMMGHHRHFDEEMVVSALAEEGWETVRTRRWGFPVHSAYRAAVHRLGSDRIYDSFAEGKPYSHNQIRASNVLYGMFMLNDLFRGGSQLIVVARPR